MKRDLVIKWYFPQSPQKVWKALTDPELLAQWLMKSNFKPIVGHRFEFHSKPLPKMGWDGITYCQVLEIVPEQKLVFSWKGGPKPGVISLDTVLTWKLSPEGEGTRMELVQSGFAGFKNIISSMIMQSGWKKRITRRLTEVINQMP